MEARPMLGKYPPINCSPMRYLHSKQKLRKHRPPRAAMKAKSDQNSATSGCLSNEAWFAAYFKIHPPPDSVTDGDVSPDSRRSFLPTAIAEVKKIGW